MADNGRKKGNARLLPALAAGATVREAAERAGLGERTVYRRLADPHPLGCASGRFKSVPAA